MVLCALLLAGTTLVRAATGHAPGAAGARQEPTPIPLEFPQPSPTAGPPTGTATRTPTQGGRAVIEAISNETNVRAGPDINEGRVGIINPGTQYPVVARRFDWYQIEFPEAPSALGWVYSGVVTLTGDPATIPELNLDQVPTIDPSMQAVQQTAEFITQTPGAAITLTAMGQLTPTGVFTPEPGAEGPTLEPGAPLPTFTPPPFTNTPVIIPQASTATSEAPDSSIPPIVPILALGALGLMGLLVGLLRRL